VLRPGHALLVEASGEAREQRYFDLAAVTPRSMPQDEAVPALHGAFSRAVQRRLRAGEQQAFLSGGLDSRAVVAELIDQGQTVRSFCAAYPGSLDDLAGQQIAAHLGTRHHTWHRSPADRVRVALDPFALYARDHFPDPLGQGARAIWSGDGGSVTLGHVYMNEATVERAAGAIDGGVVRDLFPGLNGRPTRQIARQKLERWADLATDGALQAFGELAHAPARATSVPLLHAERSGTPPLPPLRAHRRIRGRVAHALL
jgi:asparagine synthase (glutamine-hydrolysing)